MAPRKSATKSSASKATPKKRVAANGFKLPDPIEAGIVITDITKNSWKIGKSIGVGGFGEIYLASKDLSHPVDDGADYVIKVEPHSNGPLFAEMHCYMRICKPEHIDAWKKEHRLKRLGMPSYHGSGSFEYKKQKYRFMVMDRFGMDLQKIIERHSKRFSFKTVYQVGIQILDVLEYIHSKEYIHADIKASNLLIGHLPGTDNQVYLVDYGLACRYAHDGQHKEYKFDQRKAHDGTIEFTSRDAHIGAHSRRGDLEILGYNMTQWLCSRLPWEDKLSDCNYVATQKRGYMENLDKFILECFPDTEPPGLKKFLDYVVNLAFDEAPDYERCRGILRDGLKAKGYKDDGKLVFMSATPVPASKKPKSRIANKVSSAKRLKREDVQSDEDCIEEVEEEDAEDEGNVKSAAARSKRARGGSSTPRATPRHMATPTRRATPPRAAKGRTTRESSPEKENSKNRGNVKEVPRAKAGAARRGRVARAPSPDVFEESEDEGEEMNTSIDEKFAHISNPTPAMLELMKKKKKLKK